MTAILLTPPLLEPIALADARSWLRLDTAAEDDLVSVLIVSARMVVESTIRRMLLTQSWRLVLDAWPQNGIVRIPFAPFQSLAGMRIFDAANVAQPVGTALATLDASPDAARLYFSGNPPAPGRAIAGIEIDVVVGYGAAASSIPEPIRQALRMLVARWYENRGDVEIDSGAMRLPASVQALLAPYCRKRLS